MLLTRVRSPVLCAVHYHLYRQCHSRQVRRFEARRNSSLIVCRAPYNYNALNIGLVILSFGVGSIIGSIGGGRWSDRVLRKLKRANGGVSVPEVRPMPQQW